MDILSNTIYMYVRGFSKSSAQKDSSEIVLANVKGKVYFASICRLPSNKARYIEYQQFLPLPAIPADTYWKGNLFDHRSVK